MRLGSRWSGDESAWGSVNYGQAAHLNIEDSGLKWSVLQLSSG